MKFILLHENVKEINSMKVTSNRKHLLVSANHHPSNDLILTIFDLKNPDQPKMQNEININQLGLEKGYTIVANGAQQVQQIGIPPVTSFRSNLTSKLDGSLLNQTQNDDNGFQNMSPGKYQVVEMNFSHEKNSKFVSLVLSDGVDSRLIMIDWHGSVPKCLVAYEFQKQLIRKASFNPKDDTQLCTSGINHWKTWILKDGIFKNDKPIGNGKFSLN